VFEEKQISVAEEVSAKKEVFNGEDAWGVIEGAKKVFVASGKKIIEFEPVATDKEAMLKKITGRTGNLRAPTLRKGDTYYVGYNVEMYETLIT
jgi:hypothetical protein